MPSEIIQGLDIRWRGLREDEEVFYADLPKGEQIFAYEVHPFSDDELVAIANKEIAYENYSSVQRQWVDKQNRIFEEGCYAFIDGLLTFIPGAYYCYVNYWKQENGELTEYREDDRVFFLTHEHLRLETNVKAISRLKGRRQGATSIGMFFMWFIAGRKKFKRCGLTSFSDTAAQDAFQLMFMYGFKALLPCFQEDFDSDSENFVRFIKSVEKRKKGVLAVKREGLNSYCDYKSNVINAYDSGRQSYNVIDEAAKRNKLNINSYWSRVSKTFYIGTEKVGFGYLPTTVGAKKEGGENYKKFFGDSNQYAKDQITGEPVGFNTPTGCVQYFMPATMCFKGCIDKFGRSVIDDPIEPIIGNDGNWITRGSKSILLEERAKLKDEQLMEHRRDYPLDIYDAFAFEIGVCEFNEARLIFRINELEINPIYLRKGRLIEVKETTKYIFDDKEKTERKIKFVDDESANWLIYENPIKPNDFDDYGDMIAPRNMITYAAGVDTFRIGFAEDGSKGTICIFKKSCVVNGVETGCYPVAMYCGRPRLVQFLYDEIIKVCMWYGCKVNIEISAGDFYYGYFHEKKCSEMLYWTPARDPHNANQKIKPGTETASPFELAAQLEAAKIYFDGDNAEVYNGNIHRVVFPDLLKQALEYNHAERTPYDLIISIMMALLPVLKPQPYETVREKPLQLLPTYKIQKQV